jgi:uncharacterized phage protein (predicted DNA packaging)
MITLEQAKVHLRIDHDAEDADITARLGMAFAVVQDYIGDRSVLTAHSDAVEDAATLLVLGELYANRESSADPLSPSVRGLLERLRAPGYA